MRVGKIELWRTKIREERSAIVYIVEGGVGCRSKMAGLHKQRSA